MTGKRRGSAVATVTGRRGEPEAGRAPLKHLERAFAVLEALLRSRQPLRLTDLTQVAGLDASGTLRLLKMMTDLGYVARNEARKTYVAGAKSAFPLGLFHPFQELRRDALELLIEIQSETSTTTALQVFLGGERVLVELRHGPSRLTPYWDTVIRSPLHASASGKILLLGMKASTRREHLGPGPYERLTERTIVDPSALEENLREAERRGWSCALEEAYVGMSSVAAPIRSVSGVPLGAVLITGMSGQFADDRLPKVAQTVKRAADMLSTMSPAVRSLEPLLIQN